MIMYEYGDYTNGVNIRYTDATITMNANGASELTFTTRARFIRKNGIVIDYNKVFKAENMYFLPANINKSDTVIGEYTITCGDLWHEILTRDIGETPDFILNDATLAYAMQKLTPAPFTLVSVESDGYPLISGDYMFMNKIAAINDIKGKYGDFDIVADGFNISVYMDYKRWQEDTEEPQEYDPNAPVLISPIMKSNNNPNPYIISASSIYNANYDAWKAIDGLWDNNNGWITSVGVNNGWWKIDYNVITSVNNIIMYQNSWSENNQNRPLDFTIDGSLDDFNWHNIVTVVNANWSAPHTERSLLNVIFPQTADYRYYRINIGRSESLTNYGMKIGEIEFYRNKEITAVGTAFKLEKGRNCSVIDNSEDRDNVITHIIYQYRDDIEQYGKENAPIYKSQNEYSHLWPFERKLYVELPDKSDLAYRRLVYDVLEANKLPIMSYKLNLPRHMYRQLNLFDVVKIKYDALNLDIELKIIAITRELKQNTVDIIEIGTKPHNILEYIADVNERAENLTSSGEYGGNGSGPVTNIGPIVQISDVRAESILSNTEVAGFLDTFGSSFNLVPSGSMIGLTIGQMPAMFYIAGAPCIPLWQDNIDLIYDNINVVVELKSELIDLSMSVGQRINNGVYQLILNYPNVSFSWFSLSGNPIKVGMIFDGGGGWTLSPTIGAAGITGGTFAYSSSGANGPGVTIYAFYTPTDYQRFVLAGGWTLRTWPMTSAETEYAFGLTGLLVSDAFQVTNNWQKN